MVKINVEKMEDALINTDIELRLKDIFFETSIAANSMADKDGIITHVNAKFIKLRGYDRKDEVIGKPISHFFMDEEDTIPILESLGKAGQWKGKFLAKRKDCSTFISQGLATSVLNDDGELLQIWM